MSDPSLPPPHGGRAVDLRVGVAGAAELRGASRAWPSWTLTELQTADLELLAAGAYAPLTGFATAATHEAVLAAERLPDGTRWPVPVTLDVDEATAAAVGPGERLALRDPEGTMLAVLAVDDVWRPDVGAEARALLGTDDPARPEVAALVARAGAYRLGGDVEVVEPPAHHDLADLRAAPAEVRARLAAHGGRRVLAVHLRGVPTTALVEEVRRAAGELDAVVLLQVAVGPGEPIDLDHFDRARLARLAGRALADDLAVELVATPLPARLLGPREALLHALVARNHGADLLAVGPWHASPHGAGTPVFDAQAGRRRLEAAAREVGVAPVAVGASTGEDPTRRLVAAARSGTFPPDDVAVPDPVAAAVEREHPPRHRRGLTVFLTGLSGSGKSTVAKVLRARLLEAGGRTVTLLDGDLVRRHLSSELGFSKEHRDLNVLRIGYVASEITKHGGIAICAPIAPYDAVRRANREQIEATGGGYVLVHVATPLEVCEARDRKGLYARARAGEITGFTGIDDPYEVPADAALTLDTTDISPQRAADAILAHLEAEGWWPPRD